MLQVSGKTKQSTELDSPRDYTDNEDKSITENSETKKVIIQPSTCADRNCYVQTMFNERNWLSSNCECVCWRITGIKQEEDWQEVRRVSRWKFGRRTLIDDKEISSWAVLNIIDLPQVVKWCCFYIIDFYFQDVPVSQLNFPLDAQWFGDGKWLTA